MPSFHNLFKTVQVVGQVSDLAVDVFDKKGIRYEIVPTDQAKALVGYLLSLKKDQKVPKSIAVK
jgi:hypothetical protein